MGTLDVLLPVLGLLCASAIQRSIPAAAGAVRLDMSRRRRTVLAAEERFLLRGSSVAADLRYLGELDYIVDFFIGDPPQRVQAVLELNGDIIWTQCAGCRSSHCFEQSVPLYDPSRSRTGLAVPCNHSLCSAGYATGDTRRCPTPAAGTDCTVETNNSFVGTASGLLAMEMFTFGADDKVMGIAFGCFTETNTSGEPAATPLRGTSGVVGLSRGPLSLVSQVGGGRFSYCLAPYDYYDESPSSTTSPLFIGPSAGLGGSDAPVTSVPLAAIPSSTCTEYRLPLAGITVGTSRLDIPAGAFDLRPSLPGSTVWVGGAVMDTGFPFSVFIDVAHAALTQELSLQLRASLVRGEDVCVALEDFWRVPAMVLHFGGGGGDLLIPPENYWMPGASSDSRTGYYCLGVFRSADDDTMPIRDTTVIGNYMQHNMHVLYDIQNAIVSFQQEDCASI